MMYTITRHILLFLTASAFALFLCVSFFKVYQVRENSMEPRLHNGQTIVVIKGKNPHSGDILVFKNPEDSRLVVKRCLLLPGDPIVIENRSLIVSEKRIPLTAKQLKRLATLRFIPEGMFFAAGDNIFNSHDSRDYGPVFTKNLKGRVLLIK